jgi:hypothetical protein
LIDIKALVSDGGILRHGGIRRAFFVIRDLSGKILCESDSQASASISHIESFA